MNRRRALELKTEAQFRQNLRKIISYYGSNKALSNFQIDPLGKFLFKSRWRGANPQDHIVFKSGYQILNTDKSDGDGEHWVAIYISNKTLYVYDSYARKSNTFLLYLTRLARAKGYKVINADTKDAEQFDTKYDKEICGHLSLAFLMTVKQLGIKKAILI